MNSLFNKVSSSIKIIDNVYQKKEIIFVYNVRKKVPDNPLKIFCFKWV